MNNRNKVYVYRNNSGLSCLGCMGSLLIIGILLSFFTQMAAIFLPPVLFVGSAVVAIRTAYQLWRWHQANRNYDENSFTEENGLIIPAPEPDYAIRDALRLRLVYALVGFMVAVIILQLV